MLTNCSGGRRWTILYLCGLAVSPLPGHLHLLLHRQVMWRKAVLWLIPLSHLTLSGREDSVNPVILPLAIWGNLTSSHRNKTDFYFGSYIFNFKIELFKTFLIVWKPSNTSPRQPNNNKKLKTPWIYKKSTKYKMFSTEWECTHYTSKGSFLPFFFKMSTPLVQQRLSTFLPPLFSSFSLVCVCVWCRFRFRRVIY